MSSTNYLSESTKNELQTTARAMVAPGRGLLAADEAVHAIANHFKAIGVDNCEENRRRYRQIIFSCPPSDVAPIAGVILQHETVYQRDNNGKSFLKLLQERNIIPGVTVDRGLRPLHGGNPEETATQGLEDLDERCKQYYADGCRFAKWRAAYVIRGKDSPSYLACEENARSLARYASICQANGLVPIVEPDVAVVDGTHTIERAQEATEKVLASVFKALNDYGVYLEGIVLKTNMVLPGKGSPTNASTRPEDVARATIVTLCRTVPPAVPGVAFLSGGQGEEQATLNLDALNQYEDKVYPKPWRLTYCYGRAMQGSAYKVWKGQDCNAGEAQKALCTRVAANALATQGKYRL